jgi:hypothetical protein
MQELHPWLRSGKRRNGIGIQPLPGTSRKLGRRDEHELRAEIFVFQFLG